MLKPLSCFILLVFLTQGASARQSLFSFKAGTWSFSTANISNPIKESSGVGAYAIEYGYELNRQFLFSAGFNFLFTDIYEGSSGYGLDAGIKYFPMTDIATLISKSGGARMETREVWRPYLGVFLRQRTFNLSISSGYAGPGVSVGLDYAPIDNWFFSLEVRQDLLYGPGSAEARQTNFLLGVGLELGN